ncbi:hypothetical protein AB6A40_007857 [Gnathostoma spinigerum]|uniref:PH domain-containing protein n=1 Tax=Gnathostoma spinigerum TaxID=75299 RepID=A0ABD6EVS1_9BILA
MTKSTDCCGFADSSFSTDVQILDSEGSLPDEDVMISRFGTPSRKLNFIIGEEGCSSLSLRELLQIPCSQLDGKQYEGWIRRKRLSNESGFKRKWIKCWMALRSGLLHIYKEPSAPSADFVISIVKFVISDATDLKTSKK